MSFLSHRTLPRLRPAVAALAAALAATACLPAGAGPPTAAAVVNGEEIPIDELAEQYQAIQNNPQVAQQLQGQNSQQFAARLQAELLTSLIHSRLLQAGADEIGVSVSEADVEEQRDELVQQVGGEQAFQRLLEQNQLSEEQVRRQLRARALREAIGAELAGEREITREQLQQAYEQRIVGGNPRASHILVDTKEKAQQILQRLEEGADFHELARRASRDPRAQNNAGRLGEISRGQTVPAFEEALFNAEPGEVVGPVETQFGFHIIKRHEPPPLEAVEQRLRRQIRQQRSEADVREFLREQAEDAEIRVNPRFGQWDRQAGRVVATGPLESPGERGATPPLSPGGAGQPGQTGPTQPGQPGGGQPGGGQTGSEGSGSQ